MPSRLIRPIIIQAFNQGGVADSKYTGIPNSNARLIGWDIHSEPGILKANQRMNKISSVTLADEFCKVAVDCSNGIRYWFSADSGKIWQEKSGTITLVYTTSPAAGAAITLDAYEYQGYIYWATQNRLHRIPIDSSKADGAAAWTTNAVPNWATFTNGNASYHPMKEVNLVLYIGDGNLVAQVDAGTFSASALDVSSQYTVSALGKMDTNLLVGTIIASNVNRCEIFNWNTYGLSFTNSDTIPEAGINAFLEADNYVIVNAGTRMNLYSYNGQYAQFYKRIPGSYSPTAQAKINPRAVALFDGFLPIFGVSNIQGDPCDEGIWSMGKYSAGYPTVLNLEFPISNLDTNSYNIVAGVEIGALIVSGQNMYSSWRRSATITVTIADPAVVTYSAHGLSNGDAIKFTTTGALPTGITASTTYYIRSVDANSFNLYDTSAHAIAGGTTGRVATSGSQSGVHTAVTSGLDQLDWSNKILHPILESRSIDPLLSGFTTFKQFICTYDSLPSSTSLTLKYGKNGADPSTNTDLTLIDDSDRSKMYVDAARLDARTIQLRIEATTSGNNTPKVQQIIVDFEGVNVPV